MSKLTCHAENDVTGTTCVKPYYHSGLCYDGELAFDAG